MEPKSRKKKMGGEYFGLGELVFPPHALGKCFLKDNVADKDAGIRTDGRWDKQMKKKKKEMHFCNFVYQHD